MCEQHGLGIFQSCNSRDVAAKTYVIQNLSVGADWGIQVNAYKNHSPVRIEIINRKKWRHSRAYVEMYDINVSNCG